VPADAPEPPEPAEFESSLLQAFRPQPKPMATAQVSERRNQPKEDVFFMIIPSFRNGENR
jgi:hypothetical protein